jgi:hypothetical protein
MRCHDGRNRSAAELRGLIGLVLLSLQSAFVAPTIAATLRSHSPAPRSAERKALCDAMRRYVLKDLTTALPKPILFNVKRMVVADRFCSFRGFPVFNDGTPIGSDFLPDVVYETCLEKQGDAWVVIYDLTRTDVPNSAELAEIRKSFPRRFPQYLLPVFWRDRLLIASTDLSTGKEMPATTTASASQPSETSANQTDQKAIDLQRKEADLDRRATELDNKAAELERKAADTNGRASGATPSSAGSGSPQDNTFVEQKLLKADRVLEMLRVLGFDYYRDPEKPSDTNAMLYARNAYPMSSMLLVNRQTSDVGLATFTVSTQSEAKMKVLASALKVLFDNATSVSSIMKQVAVTGNDPVGSTIELTLEGGSIFIKRMDITPNGLANEVEAAIHETIAEINAGKLVYLHIVPKVAAPTAQPSKAAN